MANYAGGGGGNGKPPKPHRHVRVRVVRTRKGPESSPIVHAPRPHQGRRLRASVQRTGRQGAYDYYKQELAQERAQMQREARLNRIAHRISNERNITPEFTRHLQRMAGQDSQFQSDLNKRLEELAQIHEAKINSSPLGIFGNTVEQMGNPLEWGAAGIRGVGELSRGNYLGGGADVAGVLPFLKPLRGARAVEEGIAAASRAQEGERAAEAARAARESFQSGKGVLGPLGRMTGRGAKRVGRRVFKVGNLEATQAHADSRMGSAIERALDRHRGVLSRVGLMNTVEEKAGRRAAAHIRARADVGTSPGDALLSITRRPKWTRAKDYALRILAEHSLPGNTLSIADRRAFHLERAKELGGPEATYHRIHARLIKRASKYLHEDTETGAITLRHDAPEIMKEAWRLLQKTAAGREDVYRDIGRLTDTQIAARIHAPGRVFQGARWMPDERIVSQVLEQNPRRQELFDLIDKSVEDPKAAQAAKDMIDASARNAAELAAAEGHDPVTGVDELFNELAGVTHEHPVNGDYLAQADEATRGAVRNALRSGYDKSVFRKVELKPAKLADLVAAGAPGRYWYEESAHAILSMAHGDKELADRIAQLVAIYSPQREPIPNMQLAINAFNEWKATGKITFGTRPQQEKALAALRGERWAGLKTDRFYANILEDIDPEKYAREFPGGEVTNDIWMARLFGLKTDNPTVREYHQMTAIVQRIADRLGWKPKQVQAALWIAKKAEHEGASLEEAGTNFAHALKAESGVLPFEAAPGKEAVPHLYEAYSRLAPAAQRAYTAEKATAVEDFLNETGLFGQLGNEGVGVYEGQINPGWSAYIAASRGKGPENALRVAEHGREILDQVTAAIGHALNQDAGAWFKPFYRKNIAQQDRNGVRLILGRTITPDEARALDEAFRADGHDIAIVHEHDGAYLLNFSELANRDFQRYAGQSVEHATIPIERSTSFAFDGNYIERSAYADRLGESARGAGGQSSLLGDAVVRLQERSAAVDERYLGGAGAGERAAEGVALAQRAHTGPFGDENYGPVKGAFTEPPKSAGEVAIRAAQKRGVVFKGAHEATSAGSIIHLVQDRADVSTVIHEWGHFLRHNVLDGHAEDVAARYSGATFDKTTGKWVWDENAEEKFARGLEQWAREGNGPAGLKPAWKTAAKALREIYDHTDLPDVTPEMRQVFERLFSFNKKKGGRLIGAEDFHYGVNYVPYVRGAPVALGREAQVFGAYIRHRLQLFNPSKASAIGRGPDDVTLRKSFSGALIRSGNFKADVARASARSLHTAWRLQAAKLTRDVLLQAAEDLPKDPTWLAIKVDPEKNLDPAVKEYWDRIHSLGTDQMSAHDLGELEHADDNSIDEFIRDLFPGEIGGQRTEELAQQLSARAGEEMTALQEPIENIKWIPKELLDATGVTQIPSAGNLALRGLTKQQRAAAKALGLAFDAFNDIQRAGLLILSPSYIPVNLIGNVAMNVLHQGPLAFPNLFKSVMLHRALELEDRVAIDKLMGRGIMESVLSMKTAPGQVLNHTIGHWSGVVVDLAPRRAAFLHEAHQAGYSTPDELRALLHDEANTEDLVRVRDKATEAIVDYERLSPFERNIVSRAIFVYPWIKGATHYSIRFAANHPVETMALAFMADNAVDNANSELGPRPFYAQLDIPLSTKSLGARIPGTNIGVDASQILGEHELRRSDGMPLVENPQQLITQTTPYGMAAAIAGSAGVPDMGDLPTLAENMNPGIVTLATWITGHDPNTHKDVPAGKLSTLLGSFEENFAALNKVRNIQGADPSNARKLYPRNKTEAWEALFMSGLAPTPYNAAKAKALSDTGTHTLSAQEKATQWVKQTEKTLGIKLPHEVVAARNSKAVYENLEREYAKRQATGKLSENQHDMVLLHVLTETHPEFEQYRDEIYQAISADPSAARAWIEDKLGWNYLERLSERVNEVKKAKKLEHSHG